MGPPGETMVFPFCLHLLCIVILLTWHTGLASHFFDKSSVLRPSSVGSSEPLDVLHRLPPVGLPQLTPWRSNDTRHIFDTGKPAGIDRHPAFTKAGGADSPVLGTDPSFVDGLGAPAQSTGTMERLEQSGTCTPEEEREKVQCLRALPAESYEVLEGEDVHIRCRVAHQRGKAQWRARNFLLGYSRSIPNWPRYSMHGDATHGIHDLVIQNVSKEDSGIYECQVSPAAGQAALRRQTRLFILVKPSQPTIHAPSGEPQPTPNGQLTVQLRSDNSNEPTNDKLRLTCETSGGQPAPNFEWFHNGVRLGGESISVRRNDAEPTKSLLQDVDGDEHVAKSAVELRLDRASLQTGDRLVCVVSNKATLRSAQLSQQKLRTELLVVVHIPPGDPEIIDPPPQDGNRPLILQSGSPLVATCKASPSGRPAAELAWRLEKWSDQPEDKRANTIDHLLLSTVNSRAPDMPSVINIDRHLIVEQHSENSLLSKVHLPSVNSSHHGMHLICFVKHPFGARKLTSLPLLVKYGPTAVTVIGPALTRSASGLLINEHLRFLREKKLYRTASARSSSTPRTFFVHHDKAQYFVCITNDFYDRAEIQWRALPAGVDNSQWHDLTATETVRHTLSDQGELQDRPEFVLVSILNVWQAGSSIRGSHIPWTAVECRASAGFSSPAMSGTAVERINFRIYEPPKKPVISGYEEGVLLSEGVTVKLRCAAVSGSPPGNLTWLSDDLDVGVFQKNETSYEKNNTMMHSYVSISLQKTMNGAKVRCASENAGFQRSQERISEEITLAVAFSAKTLSLNVSNQNGQWLHAEGDVERESLPVASKVQRVTVEANSKLTFSCRTGMSNPKSTLVWRQYKCPEAKHGSNTTNTGIPRCQSIYLGQKTERPEAGGHESAFTMDVNWTNDGDIIECLVPGQDVLAQQLNNPDSSQTMPPYASGGDSRTLPTEDLRRQVQLSVLFPPVFARSARSLDWPVELMDRVMPQFVVIEGGTADLQLSPLANPPVDNYVWFKNNQALLQTKIHEVNSTIKGTRFMVSEYQLHISPVYMSDMGSYGVIATNGIGSTRFNFYLNVTYGPRLIGESEVSIRVTGKKAVLECRATANPPLAQQAVSWRRLQQQRQPIGDEYPLIPEIANPISKSPQTEADSVAGIRCHNGKWRNGFKFFAKCWSPSQGVMASTLTIYDLGPGDIGRYQCHMDNGIGSPAVRIVELIYPFSPQIIPLARWSKAAPTILLEKGQDLGSVKVNPSSDFIANGTEQADKMLANDKPLQVTAAHARLTCVITSEPAPVVEWIREPANLTLIEGGKFKTVVKVTRPRIYHATLYLSQPKVVDFGSYFCQATNMVGKAVGRVDLVRPTHPVTPTAIHLVNATSNMLTVAWTQEFNGGPPQTFRVRWAANKSPDKFNEGTIDEDFERELLMYTITGLQKSTRYRIAVSSSNTLFPGKGFPKFMLVSTTDHDPMPDKEAMHDEARGRSRTGDYQGRWESHLGAMGLGYQSDPSGDEQAQDRNGRSGLDLRFAEGKAVVIIVIASLIGCLFLVANLSMVLSLAKRRQKRKQLQRKDSTFIGTELIQLSQGDRGLVDGTVTHLSNTYAAYADDGGLGEAIVHQNPSLDHFMPFQTGYTSLSLNGSAHPGSGFLPTNRSYTNSPHPSMQLHDLHRPMQSPNSLNLAGQFRVPGSNLNESELSGMTIYNPSDLSAPAALPTVSQMVNMGQNGHQLPPFSSLNHTTIAIGNSSGYDYLRGLTDRGPTAGIRLGNVTQYQTQAGVTRVESPHSGNASSISATGKSTGYPMSNSSLERNPYYYISQPGGQRYAPAPLMRQSSFGQTSSNGSYGHNGIKSVVNNKPSGFTSSFSPNNYQRASEPRGLVADGKAMVSSFYIDRSIRYPHNGTDQITPDLAPLMDRAQLSRRGSYNSFRPEPMQQVTSTQLLETYLQRYNDQLESVRTLTRHQASNQRQTMKDKNEPLVLAINPINSPVTPSGPTVATTSITVGDIGTIPPPNAFGSEVDQTPLAGVPGHYDCRLTDPGWPVGGVHFAGIENTQRPILLSDISS